MNVAENLVELVAVVWVAALALFVLYLWAASR